jgi:cytochrome c55X
MRAAAEVALLGALLWSAPVAAGEPNAERKSQLDSLLRQDCGSCHGLTMKGGLGPALLPSSLDGRDEMLLVETILDGRPGTPMPPWRFELSADEAAWMVRALKAGLR